MYVYITYIYIYSHIVYCVNTWNILEPTWPWILNLKFLMQKTEGYPSKRVNSGVANIDLWSWEKPQLSKITMSSNCRIKGHFFIHFPYSKRFFFQFASSSMTRGYPLVMSKYHRNSGLSHEKWWFSSSLCGCLPEAIPLGFWFRPVAVEAQSPCPAFGLPRPPPDTSLDQGWSPGIPGDPGDLQKKPGKPGWNVLDPIGRWDEIRPSKSWQWKQQQTVWANPDLAHKIQVKSGECWVYAVECWHLRHSKAQGSRPKMIGAAMDELHIFCRRFCGISPTSLKSQLCPIQSH